MSRVSVREESSCSLCGKGSDKTQAELFGHSEAAAAHSQQRNWDLDSGATVGHGGESCPRNCRCGEQKQSNDSEEGGLCPCSTGGVPG